MSKFVNAVALLKLRELKNIDFDIDINTLMTSWKFPYNTKISKQSITIHQLLSHTAGLSTHGFNGYKGSKKLPTIIQILEGKGVANSEKVKPIFPPNKKFKYSGGGTTISQLILMDNTNASYESFLDKNIFQPLEMENSFYSLEFDKYPSDLAYGHLKNGKPLKNNYNIYPESAAAGLWTTPSDLAKLLIDVQTSLKNDSGKILSKESSKDLIKPVLKNYNSALGLFIEKENGAIYLQHSGSIKGYRCKFYVSAANGNGIVIMVNGTNTKIIEEITRSAALVYNWDGFEKLEVTSKINLEVSLLKKYIGTYTSGNREVIVSLKKGELVITEKGKWSSYLTPINTSVFLANSLRPKSTIEFIKNKDGTTNKLVAVQGDTLEWKKIN